MRAFVFGWFTFEESILTLPILIPLPKSTFSFVGAEKGIQGLKESENENEEAKATVRKCKVLIDDRRNGKDKAEGGTKKARRLDDSVHSEPPWIAVAEIAGDDDAEGYSRMWSM